MAVKNVSLQHRTVHAPNTRTVILQQTNQAIQ